MAVKHVIVTGKSAGKWVFCKATKCRNEGVHADVETLQGTQRWVQSRSVRLFALNKITEAQVVDFLNLSSREQELWKFDGFLSASKDGRSRFNRNVKVKIINN